MVNAQAQLEERERELSIAKENILDQERVQQNLTAETKEFENTVNELREGLDEQIGEVDQLTKELEGTKDQLAEKEAELSSKIKEVAELTQQRDNLTSQVNQLKVITDELNNNEELNDKNKNFLEVSTYSKKQCIYAAVSFVSSGAFAVGTSLTTFHLAICIPLAVAILTSFAVGCYCLYNYYSCKTNTALSNVEVDQIETSQVNAGLVR